MTLPNSEQFPDDPDSLPPARRRRARRLLAPLNADERAAIWTKPSIALRRPSISSCSPSFVGL
jgi:hypothetical protein